MTSYDAAMHAAVIAAMRDSLPLVVGDPEANHLLSGRYAPDVEAQIRRAAPTGNPTEDDQ